MAIKISNALYWLRYTIYYILGFIGLISIVLFSTSALNLLSIVRPYDRLEQNGLEIAGFMKYIPSPSLQYLIIDSTITLDIASYTTLVLNEQDTSQFEYFENMKESKYSELPRLANIIKLVRKGDISEEDKAEFKVISQSLLDNMSRSISIHAFLFLAEGFTYILGIKFLFKKLFMFSGLDEKLKRYISIKLGQDRSLIEKPNIL